ncbi:hypothetical protein AK812_SmicGene8525 [Symbiodinium microadriaticum]|uniref:Uncharacterized protein n=1 Tax=Symbiodinium microadriaticum TaxID=2951 RepID=A0A1Q9EKZ1_SYMMI|nr:hypothetical protein AK812_SmicGene8525 [Symbiodinium microadriaticum]
MDCLLMDCTPPQLLLCILLQRAAEPVRTSKLAHEIPERWFHPPVRRPNIEALHERAFKRGAVHACQCRPG